MRLRIKEMKIGCIEVN